MEKVQYIENAESHFEYFEQDYADIFDAATQVPVYGQAYGIVRNIGSILGGKPEDKSTVGYQAALASGVGNLPYFPTKAEMLKAVQTHGSGNPWDPAESAAISQSYNPADGTWTRGDWKFKVTSNSPITAGAFKGAKEAYSYGSTINAAVPVTQSPSQASATMSGTSQTQIPTTQGGTIPSSQVQSTVQQLVSQGLTQAQAQTQAAQQLGVTPAAVQQFSGAASVGGFAGNLFGNMSTGTSISLMIGFIALVGLIIYLANKS